MSPASPCPDSGASKAPDGERVAVPGGPLQGQLSVARLGSLQWGSREPGLLPHPAPGSPHDSHLAMCGIGLKVPPLAPVCGLPVPRP